MRDVMWLGMFALLSACTTDALTARESEIGGNIYYVDPANGDDLNDGTGIATAVRTIARAGQLAGPGDTVNLRGTAHYPQSAFSRAAWSGTPGNVITVQSWAGDSEHPPETAVFDPGHHCFKRMSPLCDLVPWFACASVTDPMDPMAEVCAGSHPDEFVSNQAFATNTRWGTMLATNTRLLSYARKEDFRAVNESDVRVPLDDPRPSGGPLLDDPQHKRPWTYRGPGLWYNAETQRIHIRLSHTHLNIPGVIDYTGETNPNLMSLSIASEGMFAASNTADHIMFKNIVFQNGEDMVLSSTLPTGVSSVTFDHCTFRGARFVVRLGNSKSHKFLHSQFSAMLGSWVSRDDVKSYYDFVGPAGTERNGKCNTTSDILLTTSGQVEDLEIANCEFRDTHDVMQAWGKRLRIHDSLFENVNDEVFFLDDVDVEDVQIYDNVIRKALDVFSHSAGDNRTVATTGARYYYRNIIDNRLPTLGFHRQPADGKPIWRYGADFKMNQPIGEFYCYQNTFVQAFPDLGLLSQVFTDTDGDVAQARPRRFVNNLHVTFDGDDPIHEVPDPAYPALSDGNVWDRRTTVVTAPLYRYKNLTGPPGWDATSHFGYPMFVNVPDFGLPHSIEFPNADYRLKSGSPARCVAPPCVGVDLTTVSWGGQIPPDTIAPDATPDVGALRYGAGVVLVGVDDSKAFPISGQPLAEAGNYSTHTDTQDDGFHTVTLNGDGSSDPGGSITGYTWTYGYNGPVIGTTQILSKALPTGTHKNFLTVSDSDGNVATDMREVTVIDPNPFTNVLLNPGMESGSTSWTFSGGSVIAIPTHFGQGALALEGSIVPQQVEQTVPIIIAGAITISGWIKTVALPTGKLARLQVDWIDANGATTGSHTIGTLGTTAGYQYRSATYSPTTTPALPAGAVSATIKVVLDSGASGGAAYFDDIRVRVTDNKVKNAHFEDGLTNWIQDNGPTVSTTAANVRSGSNAIEMIGKSGGVSARQEGIPVVGGSEYLFSAWVKTSNMASLAKLELRWHRVDGTQIGGEVLLGSKTGTTNAYENVSSTKAAPVDAVSARIDVRIIAGETGTAWFDDVYVR